MLFLHRASFVAAIPAGPEPRSRWSATSEARTNDLDGGEDRRKIEQRRRAGCSVSLAGVSVFAESGDWICK